MQINRLWTPSLILRPKRHPREYKLPFAAIRGGGTPNLQIRAAPKTKQAIPFQNPPNSFRNQPPRNPTDEC